MAALQMIFFAYEVFGLFDALFVADWLDKYRVFRKKSLSLRRYEAN
ncbi:MAG: hypothetical protein IJE21_07455 [Alistipes sp.]|nr:hypothetical protein [Alistipes sp.]